MIRYLTKEDLDPFLYNIHLSDCSFSFNLKLFCKRTFTCVNFPSSDYFVTNHANKINCIRSAWLDYHARFSLFLSKKLCSHCINCSILETCICVHDCGVRKQRCDLLMKADCLFIEGPSGVGKSETVQQHFKMPFLVSSLAGHFL